MLIVEESEMDIILDFIHKLISIIPQDEIDKFSQSYFDTYDDWLDMYSEEV